MTRDAKRGPLVASPSSGNSAGSAERLVDRGVSAPQPRVDYRLRITGREVPAPERSWNDPRSYRVWFRPSPGLP